MSDLDSNASFSLVWSIWWFVGIYPKKGFTVSYTIYTIVSNLLASVASPLMVLANVFVVRDFAIIARTLQIGPTLLVSSVKQLVIFLRLSDLLKVKSHLDRLDARAARNAEEVTYLRQVSKQCRMIGVAVQIAFVFSLLSYAIPGFINGRLVFEGWFPFDWTSSRKIYALAFGFQFFSTAFQIIQNAANDAYPPMYIHMLTAHIHVLCLRVARIGKNSSAMNEENYIELKSCINDHKVILSLFETIKPVIAQSVLFEFLITAFVLCLTAVSFIIFNRELGVLINTVVYIVGVLSESFPVCYFASALISETDSLTTAIFNSNWMDQPIKFQKCVIIFMQRSQKTNKILAGNLAEISLPTFISILRFSYSVFAVIAQM